MSGEKRHSVAFYVALALSVTVGAATLLHSGPSPVTADRDSQLMAQLFREHITDLKWALAAGGTAMAGAVGLLFRTLMKSQRSTRQYRGDLTEKVSSLEKRVFFQDNRWEIQDKRWERIEGLIQSLDEDMKALRDRISTIAREAQR